MKSEINLLDVIEAWRRLIRDYISIKDNRDCIETIAFEHWIIFLQLFEASLPSAGEKPALQKAIEDWKIKRIHFLRERINERIADEKAAWLLFSGLLSQARGHANKIKPANGLSHTLAIQRFSQAVPLETTAVTLIDGEVLAWINEQDDGFEPYYYPDQDGVMRIGLTPTPPPPSMDRVSSTAPTVPPPHNSMLRLKSGAITEDDDTDTGTFSR